MPRETKASLRDEVKRLKAAVAAAAATPLAPWEAPTPARDHSPWTPQEEASLKAAFTAPAGTHTLETIALRHRRKPSAIASRAGKLGLCPNAYRDFEGSVDDQIRIAANVLAGKSPLLGVTKAKVSNATD